MGIEVFNRYEKKFKLDKTIYEELFKQLATYLELDAFNKENGFYTICNIYYDTTDHILIEKSLAKPIYKEKLRLRAYGVPGKDSKGYLEIKKKYKGIINKRRTSIKLSEANTFIETKVPPKEKSYHNKQVINEISFLLKRYDLVPSIYIAYDRSAFFSKENKDLRITFDTNIRTRRYDLSLSAGDYGDLLIDSETVLMEIKAERVFPLWLTKLLSEYNLVPSSFSKYGTEYLNFTNNNQPTRLYNKGVNQLCSTMSSQQPVPQPLYL